MNDHSHMGLGAKARTTKSTLRWITRCCAAVLLALTLACTTLLGETPTPRPTYTPYPTHTPAAHIGAPTPTISPDRFGRGGKQQQLFGETAAAFGRGEDAFEQGKYQEALEGFLEAQRLHHSPSPVLQNLISNAYRALGLNQQAIQHYTNALELEDGTVNRINRGILYMETGQCLLAIEDAKAALAMEPAGEKEFRTDLNANMILSDCYTKQGDYLAALQHGDAAYAVAVEYSIRAEKVEEILQHRTTVQLILDGKVWPEDVYDEQTLLHFNAGVELLEAEKYEEAISRLKHAKEVHGQPSGNIQTQIGHAYSALGQHEKAIEHYNAAVGIRDDADHRVRRAVEYVYNGGCIEATADAEAALGMKPYFKPEYHTSAEAHWIIAMCLTAQGKNEEAQAHLAQYNVIAQAHGYSEEEIAAIPLVPLTQEAGLIPVVPLTQEAGLIPVVPLTQEAGLIPVVPLTQKAGLIPVVPLTQEAGLIPVVPLTQEAGLIPVVPLTQKAGLIPLVPQTQEAGLIPVVPLTQKAGLIPLVPKTEVGLTIPLVPETQEAGSIPAAPAAEETELTSITDLQNAKWLEHKYPETARRLAQLPWVKDGLNKAEEEGMMDDLLQILISQSRAGTLLLNPEANPKKPVDSILDMPFIQSISPGDAQAIKSLKNISHEDTTKLKTILRHPTFAGGITDEWNPIVASLWGAENTNPTLVATLLDPQRVNVESRTIDLPLTGITDLHIIRLKADGNPETMDRLEEAVRNVEFFMHLPLPTRMVAVLFADSVIPSYTGTNFGTSIAIKPEHDAENLPSTLAHEVAHYYWTGHQNWINEGMANLIEAYHHWRTTGLPMTASKYPCPDADNIQELERINPEEHQPAFRCNYTLGERLFLDLWNELGDVPFREGAQRLYNRSEEGTGKAGIAEVREAFNNHPHVDSWYNSPNPKATEITTETSPTWRLDEIHGAITKAGVVLRMDEPPVTSFSTRSHTGWAYFQFRYEYPAFREESWTVNLLMTQSFEDGFAYNIRPLELNVKGIHVGGSWALSVGPGPDKRWKPGKHRVTLHDGSGNKVAEARWTVTP